MEVWSSYNSKIISQYFSWHCVLIQSSYILTAEEVIQYHYNIIAKPRLSIHHLKIRKVDRARVVKTKSLNYNAQQMEEL